MQPRHLQNANSLSESRTTAWRGVGGAGGTKGLAATLISENILLMVHQRHRAASSAYHTISCIYNWIL